MTIAESEPLIEALVKLCDEFWELHRVYGPNASEVVQDLTGLYHPVHARPPREVYLSKRYNELLGQAEAMIKRHFGVTELNNDILGELLEDMWNMEEIAND